MDNPFDAIAPKTETDNPFDAIAPTQSNVPPISKHIIDDHVGNIAYLAGKAGKPWDVYAKGQVYSSLGVPSLDDTSRAFYQTRWNQGRSAANLPTYPVGNTSVASIGERRGNTFTPAPEPPPNRRSELGLVDTGVNLATKPISWLMDKMQRTSRASVPLVARSVGNVQDMVDAALTAVGLPGKSIPLMRDPYMNQPGMGPTAQGLLNATKEAWNHGEGYTPVLLPDANLNPLVRSGLGLAADIGLDPLNFISPETIADVVSPVAKAIYNSDPALQAVGSGVKNVANAAINKAASARGSGAAELASNIGSYLHQPTKDIRQAVGDLLDQSKASTAIRKTAIKPVMDLTADTTRNVAMDLNNLSPLQRRGYEAVNWLTGQYPSKVEEDLHGVEDATKSILKGNGLNMEPSPFTSQNVIHDRTVQELQQNPQSLQDLNYAAGANDNLANDIINRGPLPPDKPINANAVTPNPLVQDGYLTRPDTPGINPKEFTNAYKEANAWDRQAKGLQAVDPMLAQSLKDKSSVIRDNTARAEAESILAKDYPQLYSQRGANPLGTFKTQLEVPSYGQHLLGDLTQGYGNAISMAEQEKLFQNIKNVRIPQTLPNGTSQLMPLYRTNYKDGWLPLVGSRFGVLEGKYLPRSVWNDVMNTLSPKQPGLTGSIIDTLDPYVQLWKWSKTAGSPSAMARNWLSNKELMQQAGVNPLMAAPDLLQSSLGFKIPAFGKVNVPALDTAGNIIKDASGKVQYAKQTVQDVMNDANKYSGSNVFSETFSKNELSRAGRGNAPDIMMQAFKSMPDKAQQIGNIVPRMAQKYIGKTSDMYGAIEQADKFGIYLNLIKQGKSPAEAAKTVQAILYDYSKNPAWLNTLKRSPVGGPFLTYSYKTLGKTMNDLYTHPQYLSHRVNTISDLNNYLNFSPSDQNQATKEAPYLNPESMQLPAGNVRLPGQTNYRVNGQPEQASRYIDLSYVEPTNAINDITDIGKAITNPGDTLASGQAPGLTRSLGGPALSLYKDLSANKDSFTQKPIIDPNGREGALKQLFNYGVRQWGPNVPLLNPYSSTGNLFSRYMETGKDKSGRPIHGYDVPLAMLGLQPKYQEVDKSQLFQGKKDVKDVKGVAFAIGKLQQDLSNGVVSPREYNQYLGKLKQDMVDGRTELALDQAKAQGTILNKDDVQRQIQQEIDRTYRFK